MKRTNILAMSAIVFSCFIGCGESGTEIANTETAKSPEPAATPFQKLTLIQQQLNRESASSQEFAAELSAQNLAAQPDPFQPTTFKAPPPQSERATQQQLLSLTKLTQQAQQLESDFQFKQSEKLWAEIRSELESTYGKNSWQAANAELSETVARLSSDFSAKQLAQLSRITELSSQMEEALSEKNFRAAADITELSHQLTNQLYGDRSPIAGKQQLQLGRIHQGLGEFSDAITCYDRAIVLLNKTFPTNHPDICVAHDQLGKIYSAQGPPPLALSNLKTATRLAGSIWGENSVEYARRANELGVAFYKTGELDTAEKILMASQLIRTQQLGNSDPAIGHSAFNIAIVNLAQNNLPDAIMNFSIAREIFAMAGDEHVSFRLLAEKKLATAYLLSSSPELAEPILKNVVQTIRLLKNDNAATPTAIAEAEFQYAVALCRQGKYQTAEPLLVSALNVQRRELGITNAATKRTVNAYSLMLKQTKQTEKAQQFEEQIRVANQNDNANPDRKRNP